MLANQSTPEVTRALKPCPFCGEKEPVEQPFIADGLNAMRPLGIRYIHCEACGADGPGKDDIAPARTAWNTRTPARGGDELREAYIRNVHIGFGIGGEPTGNAETPYRLFVREDIVSPDYDGPALREFMERIGVAWLRQVAPHRLASTDMAGAGEGFKWPEPKFLSVQSGAELNPARITAAFELINCELVVGEQFRLVEMLLDGTEYTVAAPQVEGLTSGEGLRALSDRATPGPWAWEQCGDKEDVPVVGIAFPGDDPDCKAPYEGEFRDSDASRMTIAYDWQWCDGNSPSANAAFAVACVNYVRAMLAASPKATATASVREGDREAAVAIARKLMVEHFGPGKSSANPASWVIDAMLEFAASPKASLTDSGTAATIGGERA